MSGHDQFSIQSGCRSVITTAWDSMMESLRTSFRSRNASGPADSGVTESTSSSSDGQLTDHSQHGSPSKTAESRDQPEEPLEPVLTTVNFRSKEGICGQLGNLYLLIESHGTGFRFICASLPPEVALRDGKPRPPDPGAHVKNEDRPVENLHTLLTAKNKSLPEWSHHLATNEAGQHCFDHLLDDNHLLPCKPGGQIRAWIEDKTAAGRESFQLPSDQDILYDKETYWMPEFFTLLQPHLHL